MNGGQFICVMSQFWMLRKGMKNVICTESSFTLVNKSDVLCFFLEEVYAAVVAIQTLSLPTRHLVGVIHIIIIVKIVKSEQRKFLSCLLPPIATIIIVMLSSMYVNNQNNEWQVKKKCFIHRLKLSLATSSYLPA